MTINDRARRRAEGTAMREAYSEAADKKRREAAERSLAERRIIISKMAAGLGRLRSGETEVEG